MKTNDIVNINYFEIAETGTLEDSDYDPELSKDLKEFAKFFFEWQLNGNMDIRERKCRKMAKTMRTIAEYLEA